jgi:diguanylate cyclase (GGDEF)-like protein
LGARDPAASGAALPVHASPRTGGAENDAYIRLVEVFHRVVAEDASDNPLELIADGLAEFVPYDTLAVYEAREADRLLVPVLARDRWAAEILRSRIEFGKGITGWAVDNKQALLVNDAHLDARTEVVPGTPLEPESLMSIPLIAHGSVKGVLNLYRLGTEAHFEQEELGLASRFADVAALALESAERRARLEHEAKTDSLTGLYNHRYFHERLKAELARALRARDAAAVLMIDIDDFKHVNDVYGHGIGDGVLLTLSEILVSTVRGSDVVCRLGGEEFGIILPSCDAGDALGLAARIAERVSRTDFDPAGKLTISIGAAQGPEHATDARELVACADAAMLEAKRKGKDRIALFGGEVSDDSARYSRSNVRSMAHLKMLQSLAGKLNRLNDIHQIGATIASELRTLIDYQSCIVYLTEDDMLTPVAAKGEFAEILRERPGRLVRRVGSGIVGRAAQQGRSMLIPNTRECDFAVSVPGTPEIEESVVAVPLSYGAKVIGVLMVSGLGTERFDEDDVRLLEVLAGHASVALENARLYQSQRREAENAKALLEFADSMSKLSEAHLIAIEAVRSAARLLESQQASLWVRNDSTHEFRCVSHQGYAGDPSGEPVIRARVGRKAGEELLARGRDPFVLTAAEQEAFFSTPSGVVARPVAIAPLSGMSGWITVRHPSLDGVHFNPDRLRLLAGIASQASVALQKAELHRNQKENAEIANALLEFSSRLAASEDLDGVIHSIVEQTARILGSPQTSVWLQEAGGDLGPRAAWGYDESTWETLRRLNISEQSARGFLAGHEPFVFRPEDFRKLTQASGSAVFDDRPLLAVAPLRLEQGKMGAILTTAPALGDYEFSERKMRLLTGIAHQAKIAIENVTSFESLEETFLATVESLANALEAKDEYTSSHARWITDMSLEVGRALGLEGADLKRLELGALFHDIGKIGIPTDILSKPGPLTDEEWEIVKTHPEMGEKILAPIERLGDVRRIIRHCHEHYDGSGYPDSRSGEDIPIESRIILVVDAFHAMVSDRPYRKGMSSKRACQILEAEAGRQFDPHVVGVFLDLISNNRKLAIP